MGGVNISLANGQLGATVQTDDGIVGLIATGGIDGYTLGDPLLITSMANAGTQGVTVAGSPFLYRILKDFYSVAGSGAQIYVLPVANTVTLAMMDGDAYAVKLLNYAGGKIKVLAFMTDDTAVYIGMVTVTHGLNADVATLLNNMEVVASSYQAAQKPFRYIIGGTSYSGVPGDLVDLLAGTTNSRGAVFLGDTGTTPGDARDQAAIGLLMGRIASIPVEEKISRLKTGPLPNLLAYTGPYSITDPAHVEDCAVIAGRGYITWAIYPGVAGIFFSGDATASATDNDYHFLARGRVMDKAQIITYAALIKEVDDKVPTVAGGKPNPGYLKYIEQKAIGALDTNMTDKGEIVEAACTINPDQNITATGRLAVKAQVRPYGYAEFLDVELGFIV